ncbi:MAG: AIM24 family protein, partial [Dehalococcoidia bacterium]
MDTKIIGTTLPVLEVVLQPGESIIAESGELSWMSSAIELHTSTQKAGGGGIFGAVKRSLGGGSLFMSEYTARNAAGYVAFATKVPGKILPVPVGPNQAYLIHHHGFLCGTPEIVLSVGFQRSLGAGVFGGDGFLLQKLGGNGEAWIELDG